MENLESEIRNEKRGRKRIVDYGISDCGLRNAEWKIWNPKSEMRVRNLPSEIRNGCCG
ncbi:MAG: hypothetical protein AB1797_03960 [bacterium]